MKNNKKTALVMQRSASGHNFSSAVVDVLHYFKQEMLGVKKVYFSKLFLQVMLDIR